jgi:hypothetical protein
MAKNAKSGRPAFKPTAVQRRMVRNAAATGMSHEEIAIALEIHRHTLEKHFADDLAGGALKRQMEFRDALARAGLKGNVSALKQLMQMTPTLAIPSVEPAKPEPPEKPRGKKEQQEADAVTAAKGTEWDDLIGAGAKVVPIRQVG